ncbi:uncharacterized protein MELLADRAFT_106306 [Melampsora larici-populina 98AG31]|uniref:Uncharacterized protein n=1 Tax=Melampsora larici-populina (strain 98AG31 / pathotype 3-4-7) TaxID=747676 RepID=F4RKY2_MELLP|nr:uncharacterized protein MELLADRAFT_106306 [Melampsora larici-populina 98AG31]EGG06804.1 hypothetical protein MELLADRAFT_106306 [Melampsora larici-populina 98AG31]
MPSHDILQLSGEAFLSESASVVTTPDLTSGGSLMEIPVRGTSSTGAESVHGLVEPAEADAEGDGTLTKSKQAGTTSALLKTSNRSVYKVRARPAARHSPSEVVVGAGTVIQVSMPQNILTFRLDLPSKHAAFLYQLELGRTVDLSNSRDCNEWCVREMQGNGVALPFEGIVRFHGRWSSSATSGRDHAVKLVSAHSYVARMLQLFKARLRQLWHVKRVPEFHHWFLRCSALHMCKLLTIGCII